MYQLSMFETQSDTKLCSKYRLELIKEGSFNYGDIRVSSPETVNDFLRDNIRMHLQAEEISVAICLNTKNQIVGFFEVSRGSLNAAIVHPREVFKRVMLLNSASFIFAHNHPSGITTPSHEDECLTKRLVESGEVLGVPMLDHIIVGEESYYSFKEGGMI